MSLFASSSTPHALDYNAITTYVETFLNTDRNRFSSKCYSKEDSLIFSDYPLSENRRDFYHFARTGFGFTLWTLSPNVQFYYAHPWDMLAYSKHSQEFACTQEKYEQEKPYTQKARMQLLCIGLCIQFMLYETLQTALLSTNNQYLVWEYYHHYSETKGFLVKEQTYGIANEVLYGTINKGFDNYAGANIIGAFLMHVRDTLNNTPPEKRKNLFFYDLSRAIRSHNSPDFSLSKHSKVPNNTQVTLENTHLTFVTAGMPIQDDRAHSISTSNSNSQPTPTSRIQHIKDHVMYYKKTYCLISSVLCFCVLYASFYSKHHTVIAPFLMKKIFS